jgi:hypothetical protein
VTVDFGSRASRTRIDVDTPGVNFRRRARVEASQDGQSWQILRQVDWLFSVRHETGAYTKGWVTLPDNDFRYLRVTVFNAPDDPEKVAIRKVTARHVKRTPARTVEVELEARSVSVSEKPKLKATEITVDLGYENLPLSELEMGFDDANFLRRVAVSGRNRETRTVFESVEDAPPRKREVDVPWERLTGGTVHRFSATDGQVESSNLRLPVGGRYRYLLIRIHNGDDAPLKFTGLRVRRLQYYLSSQPDPEGPYRLYLGNDKATAPQYDLAHFIGRLRAEGVTRAHLAGVLPNPLFAAEAKVVPLSERYKWALWGALIVVLAALGVLVYRQARRAGPAEAEA